MDRRSFCRSAVGIAGVALGTTGVSSVTATDGIYDALVTTRPRFFDGGSEVFEYQDQYKTVEGDVPSGYADDIFVWVHGHNSKYEDAQQSFDQVTSACGDQGWNPFVIGYAWDSVDDWIFGGFSAADFETSENHAWQNATNLANLLGDIDADNPTADVHVGCHSLGARVVLEACKTLAEDGSYDANVNSVTILGGAVDDDQIHDKFYAGIEYVNGPVNCFYDYGDEILDDAYHKLHNTYGARAIGQVGGWFDSYTDRPENWSEYDATGYVKDHKTYYYPGIEGIMEYAVPPTTAEHPRQYFRDDCEAEVDDWQDNNPRYDYDDLPEEYKKNCDEIPRDNRPYI
jgi:hypothetical protein